MRVYLPISATKLASFSENHKLPFPLLIAPSQRLAHEYGLEDQLGQVEQEELEYAAMEVARVKAEEEKLFLILSLDVLAQDVIGAQSSESGSISELDSEPGVLSGNFTLAWSDVIAVYRITSHEEELEWYDATEIPALLDLVSD